MNGDYRALYAVWEEYGDPDAEEAPQQPKEQNKGQEIVNEFASFLTTI